MENVMDGTWTEVPQKNPFRTADDGNTAWRCYYRRLRNSRVLQVRLVPSNGVLTNPNLTWNGEKFSGNCMGFLNSHEHYNEVLKHFKTKLADVDMSSVKATAGTPRKYRAAVNFDMWEPIINLGQFEGATWVLAKKKNESPRVIWRNYLLYPDRAVDHKATYYLAWNDERFSKNEHSTALEEHRPELYNVIVEKLKGMH
jgi:hypothetical protein